MTVTLREVRKTDLRRLLEHRNEEGTRRWLGDNRILNMGQMENWYVRQKETTYQIAQVDGLDVGITRLRDHDHDQCEVGLDIFSDWRGRGLGRVVFRSLCNAAHGLGREHLDLWVFTSNQPARHIYETEGFKIDQRTPVVFYWRMGSPEPYVRMTRRSRTYYE